MLSHWMYGFQTGRMALESSFAFSVMRSENLMRGTVSDIARRKPETSRRWGLALWGWLSGCGGIEDSSYDHQIPIWRIYLSTLIWWSALWVRREPKGSPLCSETLMPDTPWLHSAFRYPICFCILDSTCFNQGPRHESHSSLLFSRIMDWSPSLTLF